MTEQDYYARIAQCRRSIADSEERIRQCKRQIDEIEQMIIQLDKVGEAIDNTAKEAKRKLEALAESFFSFGRKVIGAFFSSNEDVYYGPEYEKSSGAVKNAVAKARSEINRLEETIDRENASIGCMRRNIDSYMTDIRALAEEKEV